MSARLQEAGQSRRSLSAGYRLVFLVTATLSTLQFAFPALLTLLERDRHDLAEG